MITWSYNAFVEIQRFTTSPDLERSLNPGSIVFLMFSLKYFNVELLMSVISDCSGRMFC